MAMLKKHKEKQKEAKTKREITEKRVEQARTQGEVVLNK